jgi:SSS family solute:Na+ symporter
MSSIPGSGITWDTGNFLNMLRPDGDPSGLPWYSIFLGYPVLGIWYWCCDQTIVQRVLAARDEKQARLGPLFCAFIKILPVFFFVLPGVMCVALVQNNAFGGEAPAVAADTYTFMITHMLPIGLKGLIAAALLAAAMQTCSAALNSTATLFAYDIVKRYKPATTDHQLVTIGKITTVAATILAIALSPIFGHYTTIIEGLNKLISYIAPPITAVFLFGVFWKGASGKAAYLTLVTGAVLGLIGFVLDWNGWYTGNFMMTAFYLLVICSAVMFLSSRIFREPLREEAQLLVWKNWKEPLIGEAGGKGLGNYRVLALIVFVTFVVLYFVFR